MWVGESLRRLNRTSVVHVVVVQYNTGAFYVTYIIVKYIIIISYVFFDNLTTLFMHSG